MFGLVALYKIFDLSVHKFVREDDSDKCDLEPSLDVLGEKGFRFIKACHVIIFIGQSIFEY